VITNFHSLQLRETKAGQGVAKTTKELLAGYSGAPSPFQETEGQMVSRVCRDLGGTSEIVVFNDEAHHCYQGRDDAAVVAEEKALSSDEKAEAKENTKAARVWFTGLRAIDQKRGIKAIYDLSATPSFLSGSGYREGTLFPWVVSDFALVEAIESGIVKIPRVPVDDNAVSVDVKYLNLWPNIGDQLPKRSRKDEAIPQNLPGLLETALTALYGSYEKAFAQWDGSPAAADGEPPPVFIVVCNNTTVSKMVYEYIAGWTKYVGPTGDPQPVPGRLPLFSNLGSDGQWLPRPRTILVDSLQLESGDALSKDFRQAAATEIEEFTADYLRRFPSRSADDIDDGEILREVMNTVGKKDRLGEPVRCVVSVSMLTEGWDANTVTHILGVRAFGTQLLCEQVVGRGLRRRSYAADENGFFTPEYADVYGVPFQFIPTVAKTRDLNMKQTRRVHAEPDRAAAQITFPRLTGYRIELPDEELFGEYTDASRMTLSVGDLPTEVVVSGLIGTGATHTLDELRDKREQEVAFHLTRRIMERYLADQDDKPWYFPQLLKITRRWMAECLTCDSQTFPGLLLIGEVGERAASLILHNVVTSQYGNRQPVVRPMLAVDPTGTTADVDFYTTKEVYKTSELRCHVNFVVLDGPHGNTWEQMVAQLLDVLPPVAAYVKNDHVGFTIPYVHQGRSRLYLPDFLVRLQPLEDDTETRTLLVEVSGSHKPKEQTKEKAETVRDLWLPAVNNYGGFGRWSYCELTDPKTFRPDLEAAVAALRAGIGASAVVAP